MKHPTASALATLSAGVKIRKRARVMVEALEQRALFHLTVLDGATVVGEVESLSPADALPPVKHRGTATGAGMPGFQITLVFNGGLTASQQAVFTTAAARWESIITGDESDVTNDPTYGYVDDITIGATGAAIDGPFGILGSAGPTAYARGGATPTSGQMTFDTADLSYLETHGLLTDVITHEMGHVLGIGTAWNRNTLVNGSIANDPRFNGAYANAEYKALAGNTATTVPIENAGGEGTIDAHWREIGPASLGNELMTGTLNASQANPLSRITAASLIDLGYPLVNVDAADVYTLPTNPTVAGRSDGDFTPLNPLPTIGTLTAYELNVGAFHGVGLRLTSASDDNSVATTNYYRESNGIPGLQASGTVQPDTLIGAYYATTLFTIDPTNGASGTFTYYARAVDNFGAVSSVTASTVVVHPPPAAPSAPVLLPANDHGISASDGITNLNILTFTGTAVPLALVTLKNGSDAIGSATADASGNYSVTTSTLADGTYAVTATATTNGGAGAASSATPIRVDTVPPLVQLTTYDREVTEAITVTFGEGVAIGLTPGSVVLQNLTTGTTTTAYTLTTNASQTTFTLTPTNLLADGNYRFTIPASNLTDIAGNPLAAAHVFNFRQLNGDADGNGIVNFDDLIVLAQNYNTSGKTVSGGNFDHSAGGVVNFDDLIILAQNYNKSLINPPLIAPLYAASTAASTAPTTKAKSAPATRVAASVLG